MSEVAIATGTATVVDVAVPVPVRTTFSYRLPPGLAPRVKRGCRVLVPFGSRLLVGFVVGFDPPSPPGELKTVSSLLDDEPLVDDAMLELTRWLAERTLCSWGEALRAALPGHGGPKRERVLSLGASAAGDLFAGAAGASLDERILEAVGDAEELSLPRLAKSLGMRVAELDGEVKRLVRAGRLRTRELVTTHGSTKAPRIKVVRLLADVAAESPDVDEALRRAPVQSRCVEFLHEAGGGAPLRDLAEAVAGSRAAVKRLVEKKLARVTMEVWENVAPDTVRVPRPELQPAQAEAVEAIEAALRDSGPRTFLLHGVTGSGKTEVYLRAMEEARRLGRRSILLVPEITLTPQTVSRLRGRFGGKAAVVHSRLGDAERRRIWHRARAGAYDVVLGPRSAVFAPLPDLGLIVIDEEHDGAYKQEDAPRYRAHDVAARRLEAGGGVLILGTATPDLGTWQAASAGPVERLRLPDRISSLPLPAVRLVDLRAVTGSFSVELLAALGDRLARGEQAILFLNRRGFSPFVQCGSCGDAIRCGQCDVSLTYHKTDGRVRCHYCDYEAELPETCPACRAKRMIQRGAGTQRVEEELRERFPTMRLARLDSDSVRRTGAHEEILGKFLEGEIDVLLGTQMVAKGLDFPRVTLVGVINADTGIHLPDYRAAERTFQVLTQVAGRAGRSELGGEVLIQTRCPDHPCLIAAASHDDDAFRREELPQRESMRYPPYAELASILVRSPSLERAEEAAAIVRDRVAEAVLGRPGWTVVLGPAPAALAQLRGKHRIRLLVKGESREDVLVCAARALEPLPSGLSGVEVVVDTDPVNMM